MKPHNRYLIKAIFLCLLIPLIFCSWGFFAHKKINYTAVFSLPADMMPFFKKHILFLEEHATDPDKRRYLVEGEDVKHYFDADHWSNKPFDIFPLSWDSACAIFNEDSLRQFGILPWQLQWSYYSLVNAFDSLRGDKILKHSADIGHYIADACVPLHTTENYDGQLTNQHGIHAFWESRLTELYWDKYNLRVGRAEYIMHPPSYFWEIIEESFNAKDSVLLFQKEVASRFKAEELYGVSERNDKYISQESDKYSRAYHKALAGMVERRARRAIKAVADIWYSAWVDAGQPDLKKVDSLLTAESASEMKIWLQNQKTLIQGIRSHRH